MNIITKTAFANFKLNKSRNILIGIAIALTALLLSIVPIVGIGMTDVRFEAVDNIYPTFHAMYRNVDEKTAEKMKEDSRLDNVGFREDPADIYCEDPKIRIGMVYCDDSTIKSNRMKLEEGKIPQKDDEIVVSQGLLKVLGLKGQIGDKITVPFQLYGKEGLEPVQEKEFTITGLTETTKEAADKKMYSAMVSDAFCKENVQAGERNYRVYCRLANTKGMSTDAIEENVKEIGKEYKVKEDDIVPNSEYLFANYVDPSVLSGIIIIMSIIVLAGILTIYSIYYVSMINKVQEYGKLKAIGATKKQIRQLVFREGFSVAAIAVPAGLVLGSVLGVAIMKAMIRSNVNQEDIISKEMTRLLDKGELTLIQPWMILLAAVVSVVSVYFALLRPMHISSKISAIEAIRYTGNQTKGKKKVRKGYKEMNTRKLTASNLGRNRKRTIITIVTLSITGALFMTVATIVNCMSAKTMADNEMRHEASVSVVISREEDEQHPERAWENIQKNNPLTEELKNEILSIDGVEKIESALYTSALVEGYEEEGETGIGGFDEALLKDLEKYVVNGNLKDAALYDGTGIILGRSYFSKRVAPELKAGDTIKLKMKDGDREFTKEVKIVAYVDAPSSLISNGISFPASVLQEMFQYPLTSDFDISIEEKKLKTAVPAIESLIENEEFLEMDTWENEYEMAQMAVGYTTSGCYAMLGILGLISILNLINTMINSVYVRKQELGILQAIGMSDKQTVNMLQMEGLFYTVGTLLFSLGVGSLAGYGCFLYAKKEELMSIKTFNYPVVPAIILIVVILLTQLLVTWLVNKNFRKQSLIERIRFA